MSNLPVIIADQLCRTYYVPHRSEGIIGSIKNIFWREEKAIEAIHDVSFCVDIGDIVGLIGPNGAGKSTTIKILTGILTPSSGTASLLGLTPHLYRQRVAHHIGAVFGQRTQLWWDLTPLDGFGMLKYIYDIPLAKYELNLRNYVEILGIGSFLSQPVRKLSLGQRVRADLVASLLHDPTVLFLDEPMIGLDILVKERVRTLISHLSKEKGTTILLTTHDLRDVEAVCNRALIITKGRIVYDGSLCSLKGRMGGTQTLNCTLKTSEVDLSSLIEKLGQTINVSFSAENRELHVHFNSLSVSPPVIIKLIMEHYDVEQLSLFETPFEDIIKPFYDV